MHVIRDCRYCQVAVCLLDTERLPSPQPQQNECNENQRTQRQIEDGKTAVRVTIGAKVPNERKGDRECKPEGRDSCAS